MSDHIHDHHHDDDKVLTFEEKFVKLLEHWIKHNEDHADTYRKWMGKVEGSKVAGAYEVLNKAAAMTEMINNEFKEVLRQIR